MGRQSWQVKLKTPNLLSIFNFKNKALKRSSLGLCAAAINLADLVELAVHFADNFTKGEINKFIHQSSLAIKYLPAYDNVRG